MHFGTSFSFFAKKVVFNFRNSEKNIWPDIIICPKDSIFFLDEKPFFLLSGSETLNPRLFLFCLSSLTLWEYCLGVIVFATPSPLHLKVVSYSLRVCMCVVKVSNIKTGSVSKQVKSPCMVLTTRKVSPAQPVFTAIYRYMWAGVNNNQLFSL